MATMRSGGRPVEKAPWILETLGVLLLLVNMLFSAAVAPARTEGASEVLGRVFAPLFLGLIVVGLFSVSRGMRNRRSRAKVFLVTMCVVLLGNCGRIGSRVAEQNRSTSRHDRDPASSEATARPPMTEPARIPVRQHQAVRGRLPHANSAPIVVDRR